ncbi:MAG: autotransporter-associated beta strand repeat-containing protein, partial [Tepidisphaeraceae bacterium]
MRTNRNAVLAAAVAATLAAGAVPGRAATWDGGSGTWSTSVGQWDGGQVWAQGSDAAFGAPSSSTVSLGESITVGAITYGEFSDGLTINLNSFNFTQTAGSSFFVDPGPALPDTSVIPSSITITNTGGTTGTYSFSAHNNGGPRLSGNMNVTYTGAGTWTPIANNNFTGVLWLQGSAAPGAGTVRTDNGNSSLGSAAGLIKLDATTNLRLDTPGSSITETYTRDIELIGTSQRLNTNGVFEITLAGVLSGSGTLNQNFNQGALVLRGNNTYSGATTLGGQQVALVLAHDNALGSSPSVTITNQSTLAFKGDANGTTNVGAVPLSLNSSNSTSGVGMVHNYDGNNSFAGNIMATNTTQKAYSVEANSALTLSGIISHTATQARNDSSGMIKRGDGTLVLTGANVFGHRNGGGAANGTLVEGGTLLLDFSQSGVDSNIINNGHGVAPYTITGSRTSGLHLAGGTLVVKGGGAGDVNFQEFNNDQANDSLVGFRVLPGASSVVADQNGATSLTVNLGKLSNSQRLVGGTVDFTLPTTGAFVLPIDTSAPTTTVGADNAIMTANGAAFATVGGTDWAATDVLASNARNIVAGSSIGGFYTANGASSLSGNADMSAGVDTTLAGDATTTSLRFHNSGTRSINAGGNILTTGGILVTSSGNGPTSITGGTLRGAISPTNALQDLVVIQNNTAAALSIDATIVDNTNATGLTKAGPGTLDLTAANSYTGTTTVTGGTLKLSHAAALGGGNLALNGGVVALTAASGDFTRSLGTGANQVRFLSTGGGFAAYGGERTVNLGASVTWQSTANFLPSFATLKLGADDADGTVNLVNSINLIGAFGTPIVRTVHVANGSAAVDAKLSGILSGGSGGLRKTGDGTLELTNVNSYGFDTLIDDGTLLVTGSLSATTPVTVNSGGTLGGDGTVAGKIAVKTGGAISPGASVGSLDVGNLTLDNGSTSFFEIEGPGAGSNFDTILASGAVAFDGTLAVDFSSNFGVDAWDLFNFASSTGDFDSIVDLSATYGAGELSFDPTTGVLSVVVPEPASLGLLTVGAMGLLAR